MRKILPLLICCLAVFNSCKLEDTYTQSNVMDLVTVKGDYLVNDYGYTLTVTQDAVGRQNWQVEGARYYALFDILNRQLEISLKEMVRSRQETLMEYDESQEYPTDPVEPYMATYSGGYLNLGFDITVAKNTDNAHPIRFYYKMDGTNMTIHVVHTGNGEDLRNMSKDDLVYEERMYHIPVEELGDYNMVTLVWHYLDNTTGTPELKEDTYTVR